MRRRTLPGGSRVCFAPGPGDIGRAVGIRRALRQFDLRHNILHRRLSCTKRLAGCASELVMLRWISSLPMNDFPEPIALAKTHHNEGLFGACHLVQRGNHHEQSMARPRKTGELSPCGPAAGGFTRTAGQIGRGRFSAGSPFDPCIQLAWKTGDCCGKIVDSQESHPDHEGAFVSGSSRPVQRLRHLLSLCRQYSMVTAYHGGANLATKDLIQVVSALEHPL